MDGRKNLSCKSLKLVFLVRHLQHSGLHQYKEEIREKRKVGDQFVLVHREMDQVDYSEIELYKLSLCA